MLAKAIDEYIQSPNWSIGSYEPLTDVTTSEYDYNLDYTGQVIYEYDLVEKIIFEETKIVHGRLVKLYFARFVHLDNIGTVVDEYGIENVVKIEIISGQEYLEMKLNEARDWNE